MPKKTVSADVRKKLEQAAVKVMKNAHAPYSKFHVGAAILLTNGKIFSVACSPCGACRQVIYEFGPEAIIFFQGSSGPKQAHITELLPEGFRLQ